MHLKEQLHVIISGRVQGVWFRVNTKRKATELGITGWVQNTSDGNVEAIFEGNTEQLNTMISWCHKGPELSQVTNVAITHKKFQGQFTTFTIKY